MRQSQQLPFSKNPLTPNNTNTTTTTTITITTTVTFPSGVPHSVTNFGGTTFVHDAYFVSKVFTHILVLRRFVF